MDLKNCGGRMRKVKKNADLKKKFWRNLPKVTFTPAQKFQHEDSHANLFIRN